LLIKDTLILRKHHYAIIGLESRKVSTFNVIKNSMNQERQEHWEKIYATSKPNEVSWTQEIPQMSIDFIHSYNLQKDASIIDIGGGDSKLVDYLLKEGFVDITVLDISEMALRRAKQRLGRDAGKVKWIVSDITEFEPRQKYDVWHDRATFHFLTTSEQIAAYLKRARKAIKSYLTIGTFSDCGPDKCSGLQIKKYSEQELQTQVSDGFEKIKCVTEDHTTPFNTIQNFLFCSFKTYRISN
jgi:hypothetical protein